MISNTSVAGGNSWVGKSTDVKPTKQIWIAKHSDPTSSTYDPEGKRFPVMNGDIFLELNTSVAYFYSSEDDKWFKVK